MTPIQQQMTIGGAIVQVLLLVAAYFDLSRRPAEQVRGKKWVWVLVCLINFIGPITYFLFGRLQPEE